MLPARKKDFIQSAEERAGTSRGGIKLKVSPLIIYRRLNLLIGNAERV